jgi:RNA polymerase-binding transcription factor DksA
MDKEMSHSFEHLLREQRNQFLREFRKSEEGLDAIAAERESELEEHAQEEQTARFLARLDDQSLHAVREIDAALQKIVDGTYGKCEACYKPIALARLHSLPATRFCRRCAARREAQPGAPAAASQARRPAPVPADLSLLTDQEMTAAIEEHLRDDDRIDVDELHIVCRKGVVHLSGALPSEAEHQILLATLTDVLGLREIVDHVQIEDLLWQTETRTKEAGAEITPRWQEPAGTEDVVESMEEDKEFNAPAKPTPDEQ